LVDAILGGLGAGDIGSHFPPSDDRYKDMSSSVFVSYTMDLVRQAGGRLEHIDLTLIGERPRLTPHRDRIRAHLSDLLGLAVQSVSLKATTTEGLGFTGRGEGLAAQAVASLSLPVLKEPIP
jgi:2-C-methyl-D-erythritol 4-phosphate cytidylyltransferase/2-C-methyl-D-erythritol 2,4-cyclodiphosphate synthase